MSIRCPSCYHYNMSGVDRCVQCMHSLMQKDLPSVKVDDEFQSRMLTLPIEVLLTGEDLLVAEPTDTVQKLTEVFRVRGRNCALVYENHKLVGIVSKRDLIRKASAPEIDITQMSVAEVMTPNPEWCKPEERIAVMMNKMAMGGFRHVPVLDKDGSPISIVSIKDICWFFSLNQKQLDQA